MRIGAVVGDVHSVILDANFLENVPEANAGPRRTADGPYGPLVSSCRRHKFAAAIAAALQL